MPLRPRRATWAVLVLSLRRVGSHRRDGSVPAGVRSETRARASSALDQARSHSKRACSFFSPSRMAICPTTEVVSTTDRCEMDLYSARRRGIRVQIFRGQIAEIPRDAACPLREASCPFLVGIGTIVQFVKTVFSHWQPSASAPGAAATAVRSRVDCPRQAWTGCRDEQQGNDRAPPTLLWGYYKGTAGSSRRPLFGVHSVIFTNPS
jgi:hypothetical protein